MPFVVCDVTRLLRRYAVPSPNGIDRIDLAYARHFILQDSTNNGGVYLHGFAPPLLHRPTLAALLAEIDQHWRSGELDEAPEHRYERVRDRLLGKAPAAAPLAAPEPAVLRRLRSLAPLRLLRPCWAASVLVERIPKGAVFIHATHFPSSRLFRWLRRRPDVKPVFFIHDLLPRQYPEYFAAAHIEEHSRAMAIFARYARAAIVNTRAVKQQVCAFLRDAGRRDVPVLARSIPPDPVFAAGGQPDAELAEVPYFVILGTIEPRKNHLLLLHVWRELVRRHGARAPKLVVVGRRGWENENVVDVLDRSHELRPYVIEVDRLSSVAVARLLAGARALLVPSFAEGYGLPIVEAGALGVPVVASDIAVFREIAPNATFCGPLDGPGWFAAIDAHAARPPRPVSATSRGAVSGTMTDYFSAIEEFIAAL